MASQARRRADEQRGAIQIAPIPESRSLLFAPGPRWRKVVRDLTGNKTRTLLVVLSIAVGVFAVGAITSARVIVGRDLGLGYAATNPISAMIVTEPFDDDLVETIRSMPGVRDADARVTVSVRVQTGPNEWRDLDLIALRDFDDQRLDIIRPQAGAWPPPRKEILIERGSLPLLNAGAGDTVTIELPDGKTKALRIAGTAHHLLRPPAQFTGATSGYITLDTLEWLGLSRKYNALTFAVAERDRDRQHIQDVAKLVRTKIEKSGREVFSTFVPTPGQHPADEAVQPLLLVLNVLGYLALALSGFLIVNTIGAILAQQVRQIGVMKAIGAQTRQIMGMYVGMVLGFGVLALLVAVPLGAVASAGFVLFIAGKINFDIISYAVPPRVLLLQIAVGLLVPLLAALWPIFAGARVTVRQAITTYGIGSGKQRTRHSEQRANLYAAVFGSLFALLGRPLLLSLRNTFRRKGRLALTLLTLTLGGGIFIAVLSVRESLLLTLADAITYQSSDAEIRLSRPYRTEYVEREALHVPGVRAAEVWNFRTSRRLRPDDTESDNIQLFGPPAATALLHPTLIEGRWLLPEDENALVINTDLLKDEPDLKVGGRLTLKIDGRESEWTIVGIVRGVLAGRFAYANQPYLAKVIRDVGRAGRLYIVTEQHDPAFQAQTTQALIDHFEQIGINIGATETRSEDIAGIKAQFDILIVFLLIMALLIATVGALGLMGTMSINVLERTREIGVMRAIGASNGAVLRIFMAEGVLIGLLSWIGGGLLAVPLSRVMSDAIGASLLRSPLSYNFSVSGVLLWLLVAVALAALASFLPARRAAQVSVREVLAYE